MKDLLVFMAFLMLISYISCTKDESLNKKKIDNLELRSDIDMPFVSNRGVLVFTDFNHVNDYIDFLDSITYESNNSDSALQEIENSLNFISLRSLRVIEEFTDFSEMEETENNFIADDIEKSILNSNHEITIGDSTYIFQTKNEIYSVLNSDQLVLDELRNLPKGERLDDTLFTTKVRLISDNRVVKTNRDTLEPRNGCINALSYRQISDPCEPNPYEVKVNVNSYKGNKIKTFIGSVKWGDGSPTETIAGGGGYVLSHTYSQPGDYSLEVFVSFLCDNSIRLINKVIHFGEVCFGNRRHATTWNIDGNIALGCEVWTVKDIFGAWAGAKAHSFKWNGSKWKRKRGKLDIHVRSKFRNVDCEEKDNESDDDNCSWCKSVSVYVRENWSNNYHETGDVYGRAVGKIGGKNLTQKTYLHFDCN